MNLNINGNHESILAIDQNQQPTYSIEAQSNSSISLDEYEETKKLSIMISKSFHKELRLFCAIEEITITELVTTAVRKYIENER